VKLAQGFYVRSVGRGVVPSLRVPCDLTTSRTTGKTIGVLLRDYGYVDAEGVEHWSLKGMPFDGLSIPRVLWRVAGHPWGKYLRAAIPHDEHCYLAGSLAPGEERNLVRARGDALFAEACLWIDPGSPRVAWAFGAAVRMGARWSRNAEPEPYYRVDLEAAYAALGIEHMLRRAA